MVQFIVSLSIHAQSFALLQVGDKFYPCELSEDASEALAEAIASCRNDPTLEAASAPSQADDAKEVKRRMSRDGLEALVSAACEAGPVSGEGAGAVREAAIEVKECFAEALKEEREKVKI